MAHVRADEGGARRGINASALKRVSFRRTSRFVLSRLSAAVLLITLLAQAAFAQQTARVARVGILSPFSESGSSFHIDVKRALFDLGYVEGRTIEFANKFADGRSDQLPHLARELVQLNVVVVVTTTAPGVRAAMQATSTVPIVIGGVDDAVEQGFVASLAHPGGNMTGTSWLNAELGGKRLDLLKQALPGITRIAVLREAVAGGASARAVMAAARSLGVQTYIWELRAANELDDASRTWSGTGSAL
jgi:putative ABC transport system substrate-binding protein